ncbi:hypothetical protein [Vibrio hannami]|uniref:hypothetical protein n=1 Tax=Vibrio hannami TaxID=2717094 RepID=UPI003EB81A84
MANIFGVIAKHFFSFPHVKSFVRLVDVDTEMSIPSFYSSCAMLVAALGLYFIGYMHCKRGEKFIAWFGLASIFIYMAIDETTAFHEMFVPSVRQSLGTSGIFYFAWVIPYSALVLVFGVIYLRFYMSLPCESKKLFGIAAATFLTGALGFEMIGGAIASSSGESTLLYAVCYTIEETLEMLGIAALIYAICSYIVATFPTISLSLDSD